MLHFNKQEKTLLLIRRFILLNKNHVERSIHYSMSEYHGKAEFENLTPMFIGYKTNPTSGLRGPFKRFNYVLHFLSVGTDTFIESGIEHKLLEGDAYIEKPHVATYYLHPENQDVACAWIGFSGPYAKKLDNVKTVHHLTGDYYNLIKNLIDNSEVVYAEPVIEILLSAIGEILSAEDNSFLVEVKEYIEQNFNKKLDALDVANKFSYTRTYLSNIFKKQYGVSLKEYITHKRLNEGLKLILNGTKINDAAMLAGFSNIFTFSRAFKIKYGVSPSNYVSKHKQSN